MKPSESMYGERIDIEEIEKHSGWKAFGEHVQLISKDGDKILATIPINTLIVCWIEKEKEDYELYKKGSKK